MASLASDPGLHPLVPYFTQLIAEEVQRSLADLPRLHLLLQAAAALLANEHLDLERYLHQLMPAALTCCVARRLGASPADDHWAVRRRAAGLVAVACGRFGGAYENLQPRVTRQLLRALLDPGLPLTTHYGAVVGLAALGPRVVRLLLLPHAVAYCAALAPVLAPTPPGQGPAPRAAEAARVYDALAAAAAAAVADLARAWRPLGDCFELREVFGDALLPYAPEPPIAGLFL
ncbi:hypothetical protein WJX81_001872 [Elliptochloris bilobata]|uniref:TAF6 C-terminal HEAT repeat domain-containing protein n=1 Tax=Elliptochloris bilobata TaxID=381761 RepID=A0AAW1SCU9_9CHLO